MTLHTTVVLPAAASSPVTTYHMLAHVVVDYIDGFGFGALNLVALLLAGSVITMLVITLLRCTAHRAFHASACCLHLMSIVVGVVLMFSTIVIAFGAVGVDFNSFFNSGAVLVGALAISFRETLNNVWNGITMHWYHLQDHNNHVRVDGKWMHIHHIGLTTTELRKHRKGERSTIFALANNSDIMSGVLEVSTSTDVEDDDALSSKKRQAKYKKDDEMVVL